MRWKYTAQEVIEDEFNAYGDDTHQLELKSAARLDALATQVKRTSTRSERLQTCT
jgi:hypothetical protein